ncbi:MAG: M48 family metallopeptidase [Chloroflexota bacterium]
MEKEIKIVRSTKRKRTIQARQRQGVIEILAPAAMSDEELQPHIDSLTRRLNNRVEANSLSDEELAERAKEINEEYFDGQLTWKSIRWVSNQNRRFGSCTPSKGTIRLSHRLAKMPQFVIDYVIVHELAHLLEANHGPKFWQLVSRYEKSERARGYLMAVGLEELEEE